jgi:hypothetical protein
MRLLPHQMEMVRPVLAGIQRSGSKSGIALEDKGAAVYRTDKEARRTIRGFGKGASVFTEDAHDGQSHSVPQRQ